MAAKPNPFNTAVNLLVLCVMVYIVASSYFFPNTDNSKPGTVDPVAEVKEAARSGLDQWAQAFGMAGSALVPSLKILSESGGTGGSIACGQTIVFQHSDKVVGEKTPFIRNKQVSARLGTDKLIQGHQAGLSGMKVGGSKQFQFPAQLGYVSGEPKEALGKDIESTIELVSATPEIPRSDMPFRLFYKKPHMLSDPVLNCGESAKIRFRIWSVDGKQLYPLEKKDPEWVEVRIGDGRIPFGLETVLQRMSLGEKATAILPHELAIFFNAKPESEKPLSEQEKQLRSVVFPKNQAIIVDIEDIEAIEAANAVALEPENNTQTGAGAAQ